MNAINVKTYPDTLAHQVAFLGLGVMGYPMAGHLARAGHQVTVYNRSPAKSSAWCASLPRSALRPVCACRMVSHWSPTTVR